jgi:glycosyltransferase involved in cell wall biosynthesis
MRLLVNTLSIGSMSGEHVVYGFLRELLRQNEQGSEIVILHCAGQAPPPDIIANEVRSIAVPNYLKRWFIRSVWELTRLPALLRSQRIDRIFNVSGGITPWLRVPQVSLAMNPWCNVDEARSGWREEFKAFMQRRSCRCAFRKAKHMVYISGHLCDLYRRANRDCAGEERPSTVAYVGHNQALFAATERLKGTERMPFSIPSVSAFAPWKGVETVVQALRLLLDREVPATLSLVGSWPDAAYENKIRALVAELKLQSAVTIHGKVPREELHRHYASHQVFCLMSICESFGIPAAEAMAFGKPVVSTDCCAIAEVCAGAGRFGPAGDAQWAAENLRELLESSAKQAEYGAGARRKSSHLTWALVTRPLREVVRSGRVHG